MTTGQVESRLRSAALSYRRLAPAAPMLQTRILAQVEVAPRVPAGKLFSKRSFALQLAATAALLLFAVAVVFLIRESRLHQQPQPVTTPVPSASAGVTKPGAGTGYKYTVFGMGMWHPGGEMVTQKVGWSLGNLVSRTTDGGLHWTIVSPSSLRSGQLSLLPEYLDATHAWIAVDRSDRIEVWRTADAGQTWQVGAPIMTNNATAVQLDFADAAHGWLLVSAHDFVGEPFTLYGTSDGGLHWHATAVSTSQASAKPGTFACTDSCLIAFASANAGAMTSLAAVSSDSGMSLLITHDGGVTWTRQSVPLSASKANCPCFVDRPVFLDATHGFLVVWGVAGPVGGPMIGHLFVTADGGNSWNARTLPGEAESNIGFSDPLHGWAIAGPLADLSYLELANGPTIPLPLYRTEDGGLTWARIPNALELRTNNSEIRSVQFLDQNVGFAFTFDLKSGKPQYLETMDGGRTWTPSRATTAPQLNIG